MVSSFQWFISTGELFLHSLIILIPVWFLVLLAKYTSLKRFTIAKVFAFPRSQWQVSSFEHGEDGSDETNCNINGESTKLVPKVVDEKPSVLKFVVVTVTFMGSFLMYNIYQERIMNMSYSYDTNITATNSTSFHFSDTQFLLFMNRGTGLIVSIFTIIALKIIDSQRSITQVELFRAPYYVYSITGMVAGMSNWALLEALLYVELPLQLIAQVIKSESHNSITSMQLHSRHFVLFR